MDAPMEKLADLLASISVAEEALVEHTPSTCPSCADALRSRHYLVCGDERDWMGYLMQLVVEARTLLSIHLAEDPSGYNEDEEDMLKAAAPMLDAYGALLKHTCPECRGGTQCPDFTSMHTSALEATGPVLRYGSRILARACY